MAEPQKLDLNSINHAVLIPLRDIHQIRNSLQIIAGVSETLDRDGTIIRHEVREINRLLGLHTYSKKH